MMMLMMVMMIVAGGRFAAEFNLSQNVHYFFLSQHAVIVRCPLYKHLCYTQIVIQSKGEEK